MQQRCLWPLGGGGQWLPVLEPGARHWHHGCTPAASTRDSGVWRNMSVGSTRAFTARRRSRLRAPLTMAAARSGGSSVTAGTGGGAMRRARGGRGGLWQDEDGGRQRCPDWGARVCPGALDRALHRDVPSKHPRLAARHPPTLCDVQHVQVAAVRAAVRRQPLAQAGGKALADVVSAGVHPPRLHHPLHVCGSREGGRSGTGASAWEVEHRHPPPTYPTCAGLPSAHGGGGARPSPTPPAVKPAGASLSFMRPPISSKKARVVPSSGGSPSAVSSIQ